MIPLTSKVSHSDNKQSSILVHRMYLLLLCCCTWWIIPVAQAQVPAPDLICVEGNTLVWTVPNISCGTLSGYDIFFSESENGPYTLLTTINDAAETRYEHEDSVLGDFFYYMQSRTDCSDPNVLFSDTLDNRLPRPVNIETISVDGDAVVLRWAASVSPEVSSYVVYRDTDLGTVPIATTTDLTYTDLDADPNNQIETYYVLASDACGSTSIFTDPQNTILLEGTGGQDCDKEIRLSWNLYQNWTNPIAEHQIWVSIDGAVAERIDAIPGGQSSYVFSGAKEGTEYCFFVKSVEDITSNAANSSQICIFSNTAQGAESLFLERVSVTTDNQVMLDWSWNAGAQITENNILRGSSPDALASVSVTNPNLPLQPIGTFTDATAMTDTDALYYQLSVTDQCGLVVNSNVLQTVVLSGAAQPDQTNLLSWTVPRWDDGIVERYELFRIVSGQEESLGTVIPPVNSFMDAINPNNLAEASALYYLVTSIVRTLQNGTTITTQTRSNTIAIQQFTKIQIPNAFAPNGRNTEFRPLVTFGEQSDYQMIIYNRYGGIVFETTDFNQGWNGRNTSGNMNPSGTYVYQIRITQPDG
ncbi:MAG: gliding motility-associated C-terminal domain-containing protein, partial [Bacteroidota bacterium]